MIFPFCLYFLKYCLLLSFQSWLLLCVLILIVSFDYQFCNVMYQIFPSENAYVIKVRLLFNPYINYCFFKKGMHNTEKQNSVQKKRTIQDTNIWILTQWLLTSRFPCLSELFSMTFNECKKCSSDLRKQFFETLTYVKHN